MSSVRSRRNTSRAALVSPVTRSVEDESKLTYRRSSLIVGASPPSAACPLAPTLTRSVTPASTTNASGWPLVSPATRLVARESKATALPSAVMSGAPLEPFAWLDSDPLTTSGTSVVPVPVKTSPTPLPAPPAKLVAAETNATRPPSLTLGPALAPFPAVEQTLPE